MFQLKRKTSDPTVEEKLIAECYVSLRQHEPDSDEFKTILKRIDSLQKQIETDAKLKKLKRRRINWPSADAILTGTVSLVSILLILNHEKLDVVTSKAMGFVNKPKN